MLGVSRLRHKKGAPTERKAGTEAERIMWQKIFQVSLMVSAPLVWGIAVAWILPKLRRQKVDETDMQAE